MSHVTNAILSFDVLEDEQARVEEVHAATKAADLRHQTFGPDIGSNSEVYGGAKFLEAPLYLAAFNHFRPEAILDALRSVNWQYPENVQLIVQDQDVERFEILTLGDES